MSYIAHDPQQLLDHNETWLTLQDVPVHSKDGHLVDKEDVLECPELVEKEKQAHMLRQRQLQSKAHGAPSPEFYADNTDESILPEVLGATTDFEQSRKRYRINAPKTDTVPETSWDRYLARQRSASKTTRLVAQRSGESYAVQADCIPQDTENSDSLFKDEIDTIDSQSNIPRRTLSFVERQAMKNPEEFENSSRVHISSEKVDRIPVDHPTDRISIPGSRNSHLQPSMFSRSFLSMPKEERLKRYHDAKERAQALRGHMNVRKPASELPQQSFTYSQRTRKRYDEKVISNDANVKTETATENKPNSFLEFYLNRIKTEQPSALKQESTTYAPQIEIKKEIASEGKESSNRIASATGNTPGLAPDYMEALRKSTPQPTNTKSEKEEKFSNAPQGREHVGIFSILQSIDDIPLEDN